MSPSPGALAALAVALLAPRHDRWLDEEVHFLIGADERARFEALAGDEERDRFVELFWLARDPSPGTPENEFRDSHYRRLTEADRLFPEGSLRGRFGERGRTFILLGPPSFRESFAYGGRRLVPTELWTYSGVSFDALPESFSLIFFRPLGETRFRLFRPPADGPDALLPHPEPGRFLVGERVEELAAIDPELAGAVERLVAGPESGSLRLLANLDRLPELVARRPEREVVRATASFRSLEAALVAVVAEDELDVPEVHYALEIPAKESEGLDWEELPGDVRRTRFTLIGSFVGAEGELERWEDRLVVEVEGDREARPLSFHGRRLLPEGAVRIELSVVNEGGGIARRSAAFDRLLLARRLRRSPELSSDLPFFLGNEALSPVSGPVVSGAVVAVMLLDRESGGEVVFELSRNGEVVFSERQSSTPRVALARLPLARFAPGPFRLRAVHGDGSAESEFLWRTDGGMPLPRVLVRESLPAETARYHELRARSSSRRGERGRAIDEMERAVAATPENVRLQLDLASLRFAAGRHHDVVEQLEQVRTLFAGETDLFVLLAASSQALGRFGRAVELYEKALALSPESDAIRRALADARARRDR